VNRLITEGNYPNVILVILSYLDLYQLALAGLLHDRLFTPDRPLHAWYKCTTEKKGLAKQFYDYERHPVTRVPAFTRQQFYFSKILDAYSASRFFNLCQELIWTFTKEFRFTPTDNGKMIPNRWGLVDRLFLPLGNVTGSYNPVGSVEYLTFLFNPRYDYLVVTARDYQSYTMTVFAFGKNKGALGKIQYHFSGCGRQTVWLDVGWSGNGKYLLLVEYLVEEKCRAHVFYITDSGTIVRLDVGNHVPTGRTKGQTAKTWCERLKGFVWLGFDSETYFISVDGQVGVVSVTRLAAIDEVKTSIGRATKIVTMSEKSGKCLTRLAWIGKCLEDHGECDCNDGHDCIHTTAFDLSGLRQSAKESSTLLTNGSVVDLTYDLHSMRLIFAVVALPGCKLGPKNHDIFYINGKNGVLKCWQQSELKYNCQNTGPFLPKEVPPPEQKMLIGDLQIFLPQSEEFHNFNGNVISLAQYVYTTMCKLSNCPPWYKWILTSVTDDIILSSGKNLCCEIVTFRKHKAWSVKAYQDAEGPHFRHRTKPYYIKKKWWVSRSPIIEIYYHVGSSSYLLSDYYPATHLETEYTEVRPLVLKEAQKN